MKAAVVGLAIACALLAFAIQTMTQSSPAPSPGGPTDADILYLAYNLEVLEAQFYFCAVFGTPLPTNLLGGGPSPTDCQKANLTSEIAPYAAELARDELAHVALLQIALQSYGINPVAPTVDITTSFEAAAETAFDRKDLNPRFVVTSNDLFFLHGAFIFEDLGVAAYLGALPNISSLSHRMTAAQMGATEAYHASMIRTLLWQSHDVVPAYDLTVAQITDAIAAIEDKAAGPPQLIWPIHSSKGAAIANVNNMGLVPAATVQQVLSMATLGAKAGTGGGFFPKNLNGNIKN